MCVGNEYGHGRFEGTAGSLDEFEAATRKVQTAALQLEQQQQQPVRLRS